eukprot:1156390-Pelagomonas_calceolata.AAC.4
MWLAARLAGHVRVSPDHKRSAGADQHAAPDLQAHPCGLVTWLATRIADHMCVSRQTTDALRALSNMQHL